MIGNFFNDLDVLYHHVKFEEDHTTRARYGCENVAFVCFLSRSQGNQELLVVRDKVGRPPGELEVSKSMEFDIFSFSAFML